jgi:hypothetical protein
MIKRPIEPNEWYKVGLDCGHENEYRQFGNLVAKVLDRLFCFVCGQEQEVTTVRKLEGVENDRKHR